ncbi:MAG TPA: hypothetical protein VGM09_25910 [Bradyrhizobium sp.]
MFTDHLPYKPMLIARISRVLTLRGLSWEGAFMSIESPAAFGADAAKTSRDVQPTTAGWIETALTALFAVATVLFVSFIAVISGLV